MRILNPIGKREFILTGISKESTLTKNLHKHYNITAGLLAFITL